MRGRIRQQRTLVPFSGRVTVAATGFRGFSLAPQVFRSPEVQVPGFTTVNGFLTIDVLADNGFGNALVLLAELAQDCGSSGSAGAAQSLGNPGLFPPAGFGPVAVWYTGPGTYTLPLLVSGGAQSESSLSLGAGVVIRLAANPIGRVIDLVIDGALVSGAVR